MATAEVASDRPEAEYEKDVFIVHSENDEDQAKYIYGILKRARYRCVAQFDGEAFIAGQPIFDQIVRWVSKSKCTLLLLTETSRNSTWINLETVLALEQSQHREDKEVTLRIVHCGIRKEEIPILQGGHLSEAENLVINLNDQNWEDRLKDSLKSKNNLSLILPSCFIALYIYLY